jgi:hypothetical protein
MDIDVSFVVAEDSILTRCNTRVQRVVLGTDRADECNGFQRSDIFGPFGMRSRWDGLATVSELESRKQ